jgi:hypothetical protein
LSSHITLLDTLTVPTRKINANARTTAPSAKATTETGEYIVTQNDGQHPGTRLQEVTPYNTMTRSLLLLADRLLHILGGLTELFTDHGVQPRHPRHALGQPGLGQPPPRSVHQLDVVVRLGPAVPNEQHPFSRHLVLDHRQPAGEPSAT